MKRITSILLALLLSASVLASCTATGDKETGSNESDVVETEGTATVTADAKTTLESLYTVFLDKLAPAFGAASGEEIAHYFVCSETETVKETDPDSGEEYEYEMPIAGPGALDASNPDSLYQTLLPADHADKVNSAAIFFNMMNMNNGTFAALELKNGEDAQTVADALKEAIAGNMWMCGFPERYLIANVNGTIISAYGVADSINALKNAITATYADAVILYDEAMEL